MSSADRVRRWQMRQSAKSAMFEEMDKLRRRSLETQFRDTVCERHGEFLLDYVKDFFLAYPRCFNAPAIIRFDSDSGRCGCEFKRSINGWEHTAGVVALLGIYDDLVVGEYHDGMFMDTDPRWNEETLEEVNHLKSLGLWTVKKRVTPAITIVKGAK